MSVYFLIRLPKLFFSINHNSHNIYLHGKVKKMEMKQSTCQLIKLLFLLYKINQTF